MKKTTVIITMAGIGSRFQKAGYKLPKYQISVNGQTLFNRSIVSLNEYIKQDCHFVFIVKKDDKTKEFIESEAKLLKIKNINIVEVDQITKGQAETVLFASKTNIDQNLPIAIYNIDTQIDSQYLPYFNDKVDGFIPCFIANDDKWSFVTIDDNGYAVEVREKDPISHNATIGFYWFKSFQFYKKHFSQYYSKKENIEKGELYIAPIYNNIIQNQGKVTISIIPKEGITPLGTPEDLRSIS